MLKKISKIILLASLVGWVSLTQAQYYGASLETAKWTTKSNPYHCYLSQWIPEYGRATFEKNAGRNVVFSIHTFERIYPTSQGTLQVVPAPWQLGKKRQNLSSIAMQPGNDPVHLNTRYARKLMSKLNQGMFPRFRYYSRLEEGPVTVSLSSLHFPGAYKKYIQCVNGLLPYAFEDIENSDVYFDTNSVKLSNADKKILNKIVAYLDAGATVYQIQLRGYTDNTGSMNYNSFLAESRAKAVEVYLLQRGVPQEKIKVKAVGVYHPKASNKSKRGRAQNRRVRVTLYQDHFSAKFGASIHGTASQ